jgi:hypothetical protein
MIKDIDKAIEKHYAENGKAPDFLIIGRKKLLDLISSFHYIRTIKIDCPDGFPRNPSTIVGLPFLVVEDDILTTAQKPENARL